MRLVGHMFNHMLDHLLDNMIIGFVTTMLHLHIYFYKILVISLFLCNFANYLKLFIIMIFK